MLSRYDVQAQPAVNQQKHRKQLSGVPVALSTGPAKTFQHKYTLRVKIFWICVGSRIKYFSVAQKMSGTFHLGMIHVNLVSVMREIHFSQWAHSEPQIVDNMVLIEESTPCETISIGPFCDPLKHSLFPHPLIAESAANLHTKTLGP